MFLEPIRSCTECPLRRRGATACPFKPQAYASGVVLVGQEEPATRVHLVMQGTVVLSSVDENGAERSFALRGPGTLIGLEALRGVGSPVEVRTLTRVKVCNAPVADLDRWLGPTDSPARPFLELVLSELDRREEDSSWQRGDALGRVARLLLACVQAERAEEANIQKQVLARAAGMRAETLSRCLHRLGEQGLIARSPRIRILDSEGLRTVARAS